MKISRRQPSLEPDEHGMIYAWTTQGLDCKKRLNRRVDTTERDARVRGLHSEGKSVRAIAGAVECSVGTVHRVLKR
jgi:DNA invertase Pin-like site-specific DNA recombinase